MPNQKFMPRKVRLSEACRIARITTDAAKRGDVRSGWLLIEFFEDGTATANVSVQYGPSWKGKEIIFQYGEWVEVE